jgi:tripartite-type tricarboxylate transporter receptor subunit TctC
MNKIILAFLCLLSFNVFAETKVIVPFGQGGGVELSLRHFEKYVNENKNVKFVAMMKPGAEGLIGLQELSKSPKDGTFIGYTTIGSVASVVKNNNLEFEYITATRKFTAVLVTNPKTNVKSYNDFSKRMKMGVPYAFGYNTPAQLLFIDQVLDNVKPKTEVVKASYKSVSNVLTDLIGGQTDFAILPYAVVKDHVQSGKLIMLGSTSKLSVEPNLVAFDSLYKNWIDIAGYCFVAPKGTPQETITYWQNLINDYMNNSKVIEDFKQEESTTYALGSQNLKNIIQNINK